VIFVKQSYVWKKHPIQQFETMTAMSLS